MAWKDVTVEEQRKELVQLASLPAANISQLASRFGVSRKTAYKWLKRHQAKQSMADRSRRPLKTPSRTSTGIEEKILQLRLKHPAWGARKLKRRLEDLGCSSLPSASTVTEILRRHELLYQPSTMPSIPWQRYARSSPNELWQLDFKGHVPCPNGRCHPLTALDDCSRYAVVLQACPDERTQTVQAALIQAFRRFGLPWQMLMDNGNPWGSPENLTQLAVWLIRLGVLVCHGRAYHPQTQGKEERFHRTLKAELLGDSIPWNMETCQKRFDEWRHSYNVERPHEALNMQTPAALYHPAQRTYPEILPKVEYGPEDQVRPVHAEGWVFFQGRELRVGKGLIKQHIAFRQETQRDGLWSIYFCQQKIGSLDLNQIPKGSKHSVTHVTEHV